MVQSSLRGLTAARSTPNLVIEITETMTHCDPATGTVELIRKI
jgi:hypothetical protein